MTDDRQYAPLSSHALFETTPRLIPPHSEEFSVPGGDEDTKERARNWAKANHFFRVDGLPECPHGLYGMQMCPGNCYGRYDDMDHVSLWAPEVRHGDSNPTAPFLLMQPYVDAPGDSQELARAHGLELSSYLHDGWYGHGALPIRLSITHDWPMWPLERMSILIQWATPYNSWDDDENLKPWWGYDPEI